MEYFYTPPQNISPDSLSIEGDEFIHLTHVMRKKVGDTIRVVDGVGTAYDTAIVEISKRTAQCRIHAHHNRLHEPEIDVTIAVGLLKNFSNYDFLVEKCTELGVNTIVPLLSERAIPQRAKTERWQKLALAAMKQCGRCVLPKVSEAKRLREFIASVPTSSLKLIPHEKITSLDIGEAIPGTSISSAIICIGPEGGFGDDEIALAQMTGFAPPLVLVGEGCEQRRQRQSR